MWARSFISCKGKTKPKTYHTYSEHWVDCLPLGWRGRTSAPKPSLRSTAGWLTSSYLDGCGPVCRKFARVRYAKSKTDLRTCWCTYRPTDQLATNRAGWRCKKEMQFRRRRLLTRGTFPIFRWNMGVCRGMVSESRLSSRFFRVPTLCLSSQKISTYLDFSSIIVEV